MREEPVTQVEVGGRLGNGDHREIRYNLEWEETVRSKKGLSNALLKSRYKIPLRSGLAKGAG